MAQNTAALELLDLLATRNFDVKPTDLKTGNPPVNDEGRPDNSKANFFEFDFIGETGQNYGTVEIVLTDGVMTVASGNNTGRSMTDPVDKESWFDFLQQLKNFGVRNGFNRFDIENISRMKYLKQSIAQLTESFQGRGQYSWSGQPTEARMLIKHSHRLSETDARFRHIESIFIETTDGERYRLPTRSLSHGRAMLEHVRAGGRPWDARGTHINHMVEQLQILSRFRRAHQGRLFEGDAAALIDETNNYFGSLRRNIKSLATKSGYSRYFESWQPDSVADQELVVEDLRDLFVETRVDPRIEQALPLLAKIKENNMKEADIFEAWANRLTEGTWPIPDTEEKMTKLRLFLSQPQPVGADADRATSALGDILGDDNLFDRLEELAETDPDADARPVVQAWLKANANYPEVQAIQQELESEPEVDKEISMTAQDMPDDDEPNMREGDNLANPLEEVHSPGAMAMFPEEQGVAEGIRDDAMAGLQKTVDFAKQHGYKIYRSPTGRKMRFVNPQLNHEIRAQVDNDGDSINVNFMDYYTGMSGNDDASYFDQTFKKAYEQALGDYQNRRSDDEDDDGPYTLSQLKLLQKKGGAEGSLNEISPDFLRRAAGAASDKEDKLRKSRYQNHADYQLAVQKGENPDFDQAALRNKDLHAKRLKALDQERKFKNAADLKSGNLRNHNLTYAQQQAKQLQKATLGRFKAGDYHKKASEIDQNSPWYNRPVWFSQNEQSVAEGRDNPLQDIDPRGWHLVRGDRPIAINFPDEYTAKRFHSGHGYDRETKILHGSQVCQNAYLKHNPDVINYPEYSKGLAEGRCNMSEAGVSCPVHGITECHMETVQTDAKGFAQPTGAAFESQLARIKSLALLK